MNQDTLKLHPQGPDHPITMTRMPWVPGLFAKLVALSLIRPGDIHDGTPLGNAVVTFRNFTPEREKLEGFKSVCGYDPSKSTVPAPFIQTLFIGMVSRLIGSSYFPITPMGLIQVGQSFELKHPLDPAMPLDLSCRTLDMTRTDRGIHTRILMAAVPSGGIGGKEQEPAWLGTATYFTRARHPGPKRKTRREEVPLPVLETVRVAEDIGRRYAVVSRDYNPHHLYGWTAKFIGFKQPIAHGMWSLSRACARLEKAFGYPETLSVDAAFKLPVFLPATITLGAGDNGGDTAFELRDAHAGIPHLKGRFRF